MVFRTDGLRLSWLFLSLCASGLCALGDPASTAERCQKDLGVLVAKVEQYRPRLKSSEEGIQRLAALEHDLETMKSCVARLSDLAGELETHDSRLRDLRILEVEPRQREVDQIRQTTEARFSQLLYEKQSLQTAIVQHNNQPRVYSDGEMMSLSIYNAEKAALDARWQRLMETAALIKAEMQPKFENASRALARARQDFSEAASRRDKAAQLLQEQAYQYADTRSLLVEQLEKMDHEATGPRVPPL